MEKRVGDLGPLYMIYIFISIQTWKDIGQSQSQRKALLKLIVKN